MTSATGTVEPTSRRPTAFGRGRRTEDGGQCLRALTLRGGSTESFAQATTFRPTPSRVCHPASSDPELAPVEIQHRHDACLGVDGRTERTLRQEMEDVIFAGTAALKDPLGRAEAITSRSLTPIRMARCPSTTRGSRSGAHALPPNGSGVYHHQQRHTVPMCGELPSGPVLGGRCVITIARAARRARAVLPREPRKEHGSFIEEPRAS
jgi:hypothetical protein